MILDGQTYLLPLLFGMGYVFLLILRKNYYGAGGKNNMSVYEACVVKSFKHNGSLHRTWLENWLVPKHKLAPPHDNYILTINDQTTIVEADGNQWTSRVPGITMFFPGCWYNIVALLEETGIRYYCNVASPPYLREGVLTYIDYDLDVIIHAGANQEYVIVDEDEYELHKKKYRYSEMIQGKVQRGLEQLITNIEQKAAFFDPRLLQTYYDEWKQTDLSK